MDQKETNYPVIFVFLFDHDLLDLAIVEKSRNIYFEIVLSVGVM